MPVHHCTRSLCLLLHLPFRWLQSIAPPIRHSSSSVWFRYFPGRAVVFDACFVRKASWFVLIPHTARVSLHCSSVFVLAALPALWSPPRIHPCPDSASLCSPLSPRLVCCIFVILILNLVKLQSFSYRHMVEVRLSLLLYIADPPRTLSLW